MALRCYPSVVVAVVVIPPLPLMSFSFFLAIFSPVGLLLGPRGAQERAHEHPKTIAKEFKRPPQNRTETARRKKNRTETNPRPLSTAQEVGSAAIASLLGLHLGNQNDTQMELKAIQN